MAEDGRVVNENSGQVTGNVFQAGAVHGDIVVLPQSSARLNIDNSQLMLAQHLAGQVRTLSAQEVRQWGIHGSGALSVRWHTAAEDLLDHWENIHGSNDPISLTGHFTAIRETYKAIHSKRLVILGKAGAGKTVLAHRLILDLLEGAEPTSPVPVLFSLSDWNPASTGLRDWMVHRLVRDFPFLENRDPTTGKTGADGLIDNDLILPVLDGFDEIPGRHHRDAITEISKVDWPLIVTSRPDQYAQAARTVKAVGAAAAIELEDIALDEAERYLRLSASKSRSPEWDAVFHHLRTAPDEAASQNLVSTLATPLMATLARTTYNDTGDRNPRELLDTGRFPTRAHLEEHLLGAYLDTLYDPRRKTSPNGHAQPTWNPDRARHWLGYLATHLTQRNTHDLSWWQLPATLHSHTRILLITTTAGLAFGVTTVLTLVAMVTYGRVYGVTVFLAYDLAFGLALGLALGLINEMGFSRGHAGREPERLRLRLGRQRSTQRSPETHLKKTASQFTSGLAFGLASGLANVFANGVTSGFTFVLDVFRSYFVIGLTFGLAFGLVNVVVSALGDNHDPHAAKPWTLLARDRMVTLVRTTAAGLASGLAMVLMYGFVSVLGLGLMYGLVYMSIGALARLMLSAWGNWLLFARLWLPLTGRLPWRPKRFLEDAYQRGVLRRVGAVYQFRHVRLRDHLARHYRTKPTSTPHAVGTHEPTTTSPTALDS